MVRKTVRKRCGKPATELDIPKAPGFGLHLNNVYFKQYNKKFGNDGFHNPLTFDYAQVNTETFKKSHIYGAIIKEEIENKSMICWLKTLNLHIYNETGTSLAEQQLADEKSE